MISKPVDAITPADIDALRVNQIAERKTIDYKLLLPGGSDADKREFLNDVSSFANAGGGEMFFGIKEDGGLPVDIPGLEGIDADEQINRMENILRTGIAPRMPGIQIKAVTGFAKGPVIVVRIPPSWAGPHMVIFQGASRFHTRNSTGKHQMDVGEIRSAFALSETLPEKIRQFRTDRLGKIIAGETPILLEAGAKLVLHAIPVAAFTTHFQIALPSQNALIDKLRPLTGIGYYRHNLDGYLTYSNAAQNSEKHFGYVQLFRNGIIESVSARLTHVSNGTKYIGSGYFEPRTVQALTGYLAILHSLDVDLPHVVTMTWLGAKGAHLFAGDFVFDQTESTPVDRDVALLPDVLIDDYAVDVPTAMRPIFDAAWNACGYQRSFNYDEQGKWNPR